VECIAKGKAHQKYEFGISVAMSLRMGIRAHSMIRWS
jgi:hypothetical protein